MKYPAILSEDETLSRCKVQSIARFGDGELRCAIGGACTSQVADKKLASELCTMLALPNGCIVGIPNAVGKTPKRLNWEKYTEPKFTRLYAAKEYGSSFITRPDSAPWIDRPDYWKSVSDLWSGKDMILVVGDRKSITSEMMADAKSIREVWGPRQHAFAEIDRIEEEVGTPSGSVILCLGATATALAYRLDKKGVHALDLGHLGMFARHAGAYRYTSADLVSPQYREQLVKLHASKKWGADGAKHTGSVTLFADELQATTILDYGCGRGELMESMKPRRVTGYDPGIIGREQPPKPAELVVCTDVLEHVEPDKLDSVLDHIYRLSGKGAYLVIATRPANAVLADGRNAHLIIQNGAWWVEKIKAFGWTSIQVDEKPDREVRLWLRR